MFQVQSKVMIDESSLTDEQKAILQKLNDWGMSALNENERKVRISGVFAERALVR